MKEKYVRANKVMDFVTTCISFHSFLGTTNWQLMNNNLTLNEIRTFVLLLGVTVRSATDNGSAVTSKIESKKTYKKLDCESENFQRYNSMMKNAKVSLQRCLNKT